MSSERSSSAVRNLRSIFENKASSDSNPPDSRGRSPSGIGSDKENGTRPKSKVRASFVPVEPVVNMASAVESGTARRESFGEADEGLLELKKTVSEQQASMVVPEDALESAAGSTIGTPVRIPNEGRAIEDHGPLAGREDPAPANPDKPVTAAEEEPNAMKPADPSSEAAVSGGHALPPTTEDLRSYMKPTSSRGGKNGDSKKPTTNGKPAPAAISTATSKPSSSSLKSPASQPKTPVSTKASAPAQSPAVSAQKEAARKPSRSSLTAPTAASMARSGAPSDKSISTKTSPTASQKPREVTKPVNISSHLTAPTAASKAKHDPTPASASIASTFRTSATTRPKPPTSVKPTPRSSLAPAETSTRRSLAPADGSFLDRMTKPTAASSNRTTEKTEPKSPATKKGGLAPKPKVNGATSKIASKVAVTAASVGLPVSEPQDEVHINQDESAEAGDHAGLSFAGDATTVEEATAAADAGVGNETPLSHANGDMDGALEATPAGLGGEDTIR